MKPANKYIRTTTENQKENTNSVLFFFMFLFVQLMFFLMFLFVQLMWLTQLPYTVFLFSDDYLKGIVSK